MPSTRRGLPPTGEVDRPLDLFGDGLHLAVVGGAGDHEVVGDGQHLAHAEHQGAPRPSFSEAPRHAATTAGGQVVHGERVACAAHSSFGFPDPLSSVGTVAGGTVKPVSGVTTPPEVSAGPPGVPGAIAAVVGVESAVGTVYAVPGSAAPASPKSSPRMIVTSRLSETASPSTSSPTPRAAWKRSRPPCPHRRSTRCGWSPDRTRRRCPRCGSQPWRARSGWPPQTSGRAGRRRRGCGSPGPRRWGTG